MGHLLQGQIPAEVLAYVLLRPGDNAVRFLVLYHRLPGQLLHGRHESPAQFLLVRSRKQLPCRLRSVASLASLLRHLPSGHQSQLCQLKLGLLKGAALIFQYPSGKHSRFLTGVVLHASQNRLQDHLLHDLPLLFHSVLHDQVIDVGHLPLAVAQRVQGLLIGVEHGLPRPDRPDTRLKIDSHRIFQGRYQVPGLLNHAKPGCVLHLPALKGDHADDLIAHDIADAGLKIHLDQFRHLVIVSPHSRTMMLP